MRAAAGAPPGRSLPLGQRPAAAEADTGRGRGDGGGGGLGQAGGSERGGHRDPRRGWGSQPWEDTAGKNLTWGNTGTPVTGLILPREGIQDSCDRVSICPLSVHPAVLSPRSIPGIPEPPG